MTRSRHATRAPRPRRATGQGVPIDKFPMGAVMNRGLTIKAAQCPVQHYWQDLLGMIEAGRIDPSFVITHTLDINDAPKGYDLFQHKLDDCVKVALKPN